MLRIENNSIFVAYIEVAQMADYFDMTSLIRYISNRVSDSFRRDLLTTDLLKEFITGAKMAFSDETPLSLKPLP